MSVVLVKIVIPLDGGIVIKNTLRRNLCVRALQ